MGVPLETGSYACEFAKAETGLTGCGTLTGVRILVVLLLVLAACGAPPPAETTFTQVELPSGAVPARLAVLGDDLLVGFERAGEPGLLLHRSDGDDVEIPVAPATGYGAEALWYSLAVLGEEIVALGGRSGGAHGNPRWSVWRGTVAGIAEEPQSFNTFGGIHAGALIDVAYPTTGPLLVGTWMSANAGSDVAVWTPTGAEWVRGDSAGTDLESTRTALKYPMAATSRGADVLVAGWQLTDGRQQPVVWTLNGGTARLTPLPDGGAAGTATAVTCANGCAVVGRVDGRLAVWRTEGNAWRRVAEVPDVPVGDTDRPQAPLGDTLVYTDRGTIHIGTLGGEMRTARGPTGVVTAVARVGDTTYVVAGPEDNKPTLWRAD